MLWSQFFSSNITMTLTSTNPNGQEPSWRGGGERKPESSQDSEKRRSQAGDQLTMMVILSIRSLIPLIHDDFLVFDFQS